MVRAYPRSSFSILPLALLLAVAPLATGCSWFRKKPKPAEVTAPETVSFDDSASDVNRPMDSPQESPRPVGLSQAPLEIIYFDYDQSELRADQLANMEFNLRWLLDNPNANVLIEGHCDERGTTEYNFALGERRAESVRGYFVDNGVAANRLQVLSKGEEEPAMAGGSEEAWSKNRRAEFKLISLGN